MIVFRNAYCRTLTPEYVNTATGLDLHRFNWLPRYCGIGELPHEWNWLVGEYPQNSVASLLHYTNGGPWFPEYRTGIEAELWLEECVRSGLGVYHGLLTT